MNRLKKKLLQKSNLWHVGAIALFLVISAIYFYPATGGYAVEQGDVTNWIGASQEIKDYRISDGQPGWTNAMFSGMPSTQISMSYPGRGVTLFLRDAYEIWLPRPISVMFIYFLSFYILALSFKVKPIIAVLGALAFGFSSSQIVIIEAGHLTKAYAIAYAPLVLAGMVYAYRWKNWLLGVGLSALFMSFELSANHLQITYYMVFVLIGLGVVELIKHLKEDGGALKFAKITGGLLIAYAAAGMINIGNIIGTNEYAAYSTRGGTDLTINANGEDNGEVVTSGLDKEYITAWSYGRSETMTFLIPNYKGGETMRFQDNKSNDDIIKDVPSSARNFVKEQNQYYGDQPFTSGPVYLGIIVVFLALLGLIYSEDKFRWALLSVTLLAVALSWGKNFVSVVVLLPIILYSVNIFLEDKKRIIFTIINTLLLLFIIAKGELISAKSLTDFFIESLPGYNKFRAVTIVLAVVQLCVPLLGVLFLHRLYKSREKILENITPYFIASGAIGFILLLLMAAPTLANDFLSAAEVTALAGITDVPTFEFYSDQFAELENARISVFRKDVLRSFAFLLLAFGGVYAFIRGAFSKYVLAGILGLLIIFDLGGVDKRYLDTEKKGKNYKQWTETWKQTYPYTAGNGDLEIFNLEVQRNPNLLFAVDSAMNATDFEDMESGERKRVQDWVKFRTLNRYTNYRVLDLGNAFNSSYVSYFHKSIGGYHGAKLGRYQELIEFHIGKSNPSVLDMLNMRYQIVSQPGPGGKMNSQFVGENETAMGNVWFTKDVRNVANANEEILALTASTALTMTVLSPNYIVLVNDEIATGSMTMSGSEKVEFVSPTLQADGTVTLDTIPQTLPFREAEAFDLSLIRGQEPGTWNWAYDAMLDSTFDKIMTVTTAGRAGWDPNLETIVGDDFKANVSQESYSGEGSITMTSYHPDNLIYKSSSAEKQLAVFSEIYYPLGWKAFVDGAEVPISRVNYTLRAVEVPAGDHTIEFAYDLPSYKKSGLYAYIGTFGVLILLATGIFMEAKRKDEDEEEPKTEASEDEEV